MIERPSQYWKEAVSEQAAEVAAGSLTQDEAWAAHLWPAGFIEDVDTALEAYEARVAALSSPADDEVFAAVESVVLALNEVDGEHCRIETGEREELCEYIDAVLAASGIDTAALAAGRGLDRAELTDEWRDW